MQWQMACTGRSWCDFVSFDPRLPASAGQFHRERFEADPAQITEMEAAVKMFLAEVAETVISIREKYKGLSDAD
jgi:hypothetical protein